MHFDEACRYLFGLGHETIAIKLGLANVERLLAALGNPQSNYFKIQIAGTNGKGSTAAMLESICLHANLRAGLYTSPHLISVTERIRIGGEEIVPEEFAAIATSVRQAAEGVQEETGALPTFFEQVTAIALVAFSRAGVDIAILETGLGGRLDATTAARAEVAALTPISLDHQEYLGTTLAEVATEKAAIINLQTVVAISAEQHAIAAEIIAHRAAEFGVTLRNAIGEAHIVEADATGRLRVTFHTPRGNYENALLALRGRHQLANALIAITLAETLVECGRDIPGGAIVAGLESARHAGRLELIQTRTSTSRFSLLLDGAHNAAGARALRAYLDEFVHTPLTLLFGGMRDKDLTHIAATIFPRADKIVLTVIDNPRAATLEQLLSVVPADVDRAAVTLAINASEALHLAGEMTPADGTICVTGSLYLVGEIKRVT